ncbi:MAG: tyrosine-type recombinase/integrase [Gemmataceae bacterium]|nr:tyrosine-type recombinase/integrase [Gemmataceae bacterium]
MSRHVEGPWYRTSKDTWYATLNGKNVSLRVKGEASKPEAVKAWHRLMADGGTLPPARDKPVSPTPDPKPLPVRDTPSSSTDTVKAVADRFILDARSRLKPNTVRIYAYDLGTFSREAGSLPLSAVGPAHVGRWVSGLGVNPTTKGMMLRSVGAFFGWAVRMGMLDRNPVKMVAKPKGRSRSQSAVIGEADHGKLVEAATPYFRAVLDVLHATGCRPSEAASLTAENTDLTAGVAVLDVHKCDRSGKPRLVFLPPALCDRLRALGRSPGPLLRTARGNPWTGRTITQAMRKACKAAGVKAIAYGYRHAYATEALSRGVPDATVAALLGHGSTAVLHKHYSHLTSRADVLRQAAARVRG